MSYIEIIFYKVIFCLKRLLFKYIIAFPTFQKIVFESTSSSFSSLRYFSSILLRGIFPLRLRYRFSFYFSKSLGEWNIEQPRSDSRSTINITARDTFDRCYERNVRPPAEDPLSVALITDLRFWNEQFLETPERSRFLGKSWRWLKNNRPSAGVSRRLKISNVELLFPSFDRQSFFHTDVKGLYIEAFKWNWKFSEWSNTP